jgi:hypothetical protein
MKSGFEGGDAERKCLDVWEREGEEEGEER